MSRPASYLTVHLSQGRVHLHNYAIILLFGVSLVWRFLKGRSVSTANAVS